MPPRYLKSTKLLRHYSAFMVKIIGLILQQKANRWLFNLKQQYVCICGSILNYTNIWAANFTITFGLLLWHGSLGKWSLRQPFFSFHVTELLCKRTVSLSSVIHFVLHAVTTNKKINQIEMSLRNLIQTAKFSKYIPCKLPLSPYYHTFAKY